MAYKEMIISYSEDRLATALNPKKFIDKSDPFDLYDLNIDVLKSNMDDNQSIFEYILKTKGHIRLREEDQNDLELCQIYLDTMDEICLTYINDDLLLSTLPSGRSGLDVYIEKHKDKMYEVKDIDLALEIIKKGKYELLSNASLDVYRHKIGDKTILEIILDNGVMPYIEYIDEPKDYTGKRKNILFEPLGDKELVISKIMECNIDFKIKLDEVDKKYWRDILFFAFESNNLESIIEGPEAFYLQNFTDSPDNLIFNVLKKYYKLPIITDKITDNRIIIEYCKSDEKIIDLLFCDIDILTRKLNEDRNITILDLILFKLKEFGNKKLINDAHSMIRKKEITDEVSLIYAKHGFIIPPTTSSLKLGITAENVMDDKIYEYENKMVPLSNEYEGLIREFMLQFVDSDRNVVNHVVNIFNKNVEDKPMESVRNLQSLIDYKNKHPKFVLSNDKDLSVAFNPSKNNTWLNINTLNDEGTLAHEWGHLIYHTYGNGVPENIAKLIKCNKDTLNSYKSEAYKVYKEMSHQLYEMTEDEKYEELFIEYVDVLSGSGFDYWMNMENDYINSLGKEEFLLETIKLKDFDKEFLFKMINATYFGDSKELLTPENVEEYCNARVNCELDRFINAMVARDNKNFQMYENFIDAYYGGLIWKYSSEFKSDLPHSGHSPRYYVNKDRQFDEMFANYTSLKSIKDGDKYIEKLKEIIPVELIDAMDEYYSSLNIEYVQKKSR